MKLEEIEFYEENGPLLENLTVVTCSPQTNPRWVVQSFVKRLGGRQIELGIALPNTEQSFSEELIVVTNTEMPVLSSNCQAEELFEYLSDLRKQVKHLVVCLTLSDALLNTFYETGKQLARLTAKLLYQAQLIIQLKPLETGRARDITGRFIIAKGLSRTRRVAEQELFYYVGPRSVELSLKQ